MSGTGFVIAMQAVIELALYDAPMDRISSSTEWLIVSRWGGSGEFLSLSRTGNIPGGVAAPDGLQPKTTFLGILLPPLEAPEISGFMMVRHLPPGVTVAGTFAPTDGFARVSFAGNRICLAAAGRYAHSRGADRGQPMLRDIPDPPPRAALAFAWHLAATQQPWSGEFFPDS